MHPGRLPVVTALALFAAACLVDGSDWARVRLSLDLGELELPQEGLPGPREETDGLVHLDRVPAYVHVVVTGSGIEPPLVAAWPRDAARTPRERVDLSLDVPVAPDRRFHIVACVGVGSPTVFRFLPRRWSGLLAREDR